MPPRFDAAALERLRVVLKRRPAIEIDAPQHRRASVLIPLIEDHDGSFVLVFSRRAETLAAHSGNSPTIDRTFSRTTCPSARRSRL